MIDTTICRENWRHSTPIQSGDFEAAAGERGGDEYHDQISHTETAYSSH